MSSEASTRSVYENPKQMAMAPAVELDPFIEFDDLV
jgi:hypothetical protein